MRPPYIISRILPTVDADPFHPPRRPPSLRQSFDSWKKETFAFTTRDNDSLISSDDCSPERYSPRVRTDVETSLNKTLERIDSILMNMLKKTENRSKSCEVVPYTRRGVERRGGGHKVVRSLDATRGSTPGADDTLSNETMRQMLYRLDRNYYSQGLSSPAVHGRMGRRIADAFRPNPDIPGENDMSLTRRYPQFVRAATLPIKCTVRAKEKINIELDGSVEGLDDLLCLLDKYPLREDAVYDIDLTAVHNVRPELQLLRSMIGLHTLKKNIVDQIMYFTQGFHLVGKDGGDFMHTVIHGPPGTGKTDVARIMGRVFSKLGILKKGTFRKVTRADLVAGYLGQTAIKTSDVIKSALGGVLFIDEAYALGNVEKKDTFAKECIDTLCEALSDHKGELMVIVAGYEDELKNCFFSYNQGLESRFVWRFKTDDYSSGELNEIFCKKVGDAGWSMDNAQGVMVDAAWFGDKMGYFKFFGRDMETLLAKVKIAHSRRVFGKKAELKTKITSEDMERGLKLYLENGEVEKRRNADAIDRDVLCSMYS